MQDWWEQGSQNGDPDMEAMKEKAMQYITPVILELYHRLCKDHDDLVRDGMKSDSAGSTVLSVLLNTISLICPMLILTMEGKEPKKGDMVPLQHECMQILLPAIMSLFEKYGGGFRLEVISRPLDLYAEDGNDSAPGARFSF